MKFSVIIGTVSGRDFESDISSDMSSNTISDIKNTMKNYKNFDYVEISISDKTYIFNPDNIEYIYIKEYV